jgi:predicted transposase YbfD/YdcC
MDMEQSSESKPLSDCLRGISAPRMEGKKHHNLVDILVISICAIICGAEHWTEIEAFGECKEQWVRSFLSLPNGIPSHDTIGRVFSIIDPKQLQQCYADWIQGFMKGVDVHHICLDGKTVRGSKHKPDNKKAVHMISAYAQECGLVLTQEKVDDKTNEITALPEILRRLHLSGAIVSVDAMGCQKEIARQITEQGGDYVLSLKGNQDECRVHAGYAAENFIVPRHMALNLLKQGARIKRGIKTRRKVAGWNENYLLELLKGNFHA